MTTPYRDDLEALRTELANLETELGGARARREALADAAAHEDALKERVERLRKRVREGARRNLPFLNDVRVATPCKADWDEMIGDDRTRFCAGCQKNVYDLSGMSGEQANAFVRERSAIPDETCVRFYKRADGTVMTNDCPTGVSRRRRRIFAGVAVGAGVAAAGIAYAFSPRPHVVMGQLEAVPVSKVDVDESVEVEVETKEPVQVQPPRDTMVMGRMVQPQRQDAMHGSPGKSGKR